MQFLYDPPKVTRVVGTPCDAEALCPIQVGVGSTLCPVLSLTEDMVWVPVVVDLEGCL